MNIGYFRDGHPRLALQMQGIQGNFEIEFIIDTGFEGELALSEQHSRQLDRSLIGYRSRRLADGQVRQFPIYEAVIEWAEELRSVELLVLEGEPLIGTVFLQDMLLQIEMTEGGEVSIEPL